MSEVFRFGPDGRMYVHDVEVVVAADARIREDQLIGRVVRFLADGGFDAAAAVVEIEFGGER